MSDSALGAASLEELRRYKSMFDNTWNLAALLATALVVAAWYFGLARLNVGPVIWTLATLAIVQFFLASLAGRSSSRRYLQQLALCAQLLGTLMMGIAWHLLGGMQQPLFPLFIVLPLLSGSLIFGFWQQVSTSVALFLVLVSGLALSPDTNSFIEARYGIGFAWIHSLPAWLPRSQIAFADVTSSPPYDLLLMLTVSVVSMALSSTARAMAALFARSADRLRSLELEVSRVQGLNGQMVTHAPAPVVQVLCTSGKIVSVSDRFTREFGITDAAGQFLLDVVTFAYPDVIKRLMKVGGEEIQGAMLHGRDLVLRIRTEIMGSGELQLASINMERCDEICWRGEVDALDEAVFAINAQGDVVFMNRSALTTFGASAEGSSAARLFDTGNGRWWDIAPLDSARRTLQRGEDRFLASIRRRRLADSIGEVFFVHLHDLGSMHVAAVS